MLDWFVPSLVEDAVSFISFETFPRGWRGLGNAIFITIYLVVLGGIFRLLLAWVDFRIAEYWNVREREAGQVSLVVGWAGLLSPWLFLVFGLGLVAAETVNALYSRNIVERTEFWQSLRAAARLVMSYY